MNARYANLKRQPRVFRALTGLELEEFDELAQDLLTKYEQAERERHMRVRGEGERRRAIGGGHPFSLDMRDQLLLTVIWLRHYLTHETIGYLFDVSDSTATRVIGRIHPLLTAAGRDTLRLADPHAHTRLRKRHHLDELLKELPEVALIIDTFEQDVQRPQQRTEADEWYSGKKKSHTIKSQVAVHSRSGLIADIGESARGPSNDLKLLKESKLLERAPEGVGGEGDLAYVGIAELHPQGLGATPRRKPRSKARPAEDILYNRAFARRRIVVEHAIGRLRRYQALAQKDREHRWGHTERVIAVAGLVNRQLLRQLGRLAATNQQDQPGGQVVQLVGGRVRLMAA